MASSVSSVAASSTVASDIFSLLVFIERSTSEIRLSDLMKIVRCRTLHFSVSASLPNRCLVPPFLDLSSTTCRCPATVLGMPAAALTLDVCVSSSATWQLT